MADVPRTKEELIEAIHQARSRLDKKFSKLSEEQMKWPGSMDTWSVKDILAHLVDWEQRLINWYKAGLLGENLELPAPGMTWRDLPQLNHQGYEKHKNESLEDVLIAYNKSYQQILGLIDKLSEQEIFTVGYYKWTGNSNLFSFIKANTYSHYRWATRNIRVTKIHAANE